MTKRGALFLLLLGCGGPAATTEPAASPTGAPPSADATEAPPQTAQIDGPLAPVEMQPEWTAAVARAEALGRAIYEYDAAASMATDVLLAKFGDRPPVAGFLAVKDPELVVYFFDRAGPGAAFRVAMRGDKPGPLEAMDGKKPLSTAAQGARQAFAAASEVEFPRAPGPYNFVVLPGSIASQPGWLVYFLSAPRDPGELVIGGHVRIGVGADGKTIREMTPLSKTPVRIPPPPPNAAASLVTSMVADTPLETHVFVSLGSPRPLFVGTRVGLWKLERGHVTYLGQPKAP